jgi:hypothetical protein
MGTTSDRVEMVERSPEEWIFAKGTKLKVGPRAVKNLGTDQNSDGLLQQGAHEHNVGKVDSYRAGETSGAQMVFDPGEEKQDASRKPKSEQDNCRHKGKHRLLVAERQAGRRRRKCQTLGLTKEQRNPQTRERRKITSEIGADLIGG